MIAHVDGFLASFSVNISSPEQVAKCGNEFNSVLHILHKGIVRLDPSYVLYNPPVIIWEKMVWVFLLFSNNLKQTFALDLVIFRSVFM